MEPVEGAEKRSNKKAIAVAAVLVVSAVLALSFTLGATKTNSAVNSNLGRADVAIVDGEVKELFDYACANALTERFVLSTFDGKKTLRWARRGPR